MQNSNNSHMKRSFGWYLDKILNLFLMLCVVALIWIFLQVLCIATFKIPSDSMEPTLLAGDKTLVNKGVMGGRLFNVWGALEGKDIHIYRLPGFGKLKRNDVIVFNFPYHKQRWDSIAFDVMKYYVKRCVALPGDTFEIKDARYKVRGKDTYLGNVKAQETLIDLVKRGKAEELGIVMRGYPYNSVFTWDIVNFGPVYIPAKGDNLKMDPMHVILYKNIIEWEQQKKLFVRGDTVLLNDSVIQTYCFIENYYFVAGDKVMNSQDSRYWGLLPEPFIVGKAVRIWKSVDNNTDRIRWNRIFKKIE